MTNETLTADATETQMLKAIHEAYNLAALHVSQCEREADGLYDRAMDTGTEAAEQAYRKASERWDAAKQVYRDLGDLLTTNSI